MKPGVQQIAPDLWQGALAHVVRDWSSVLASGVNCVVCLAGEVEIIPRDGPPVFLLPIDDNDQGTDHFDELVHLSRLFAPQRVLTICHMGENRSGLLSALILVARGYTPEQAVTLVQERGPHNSETQPHSFWNPGFVRQVKGLA